MIETTFIDTINDILKYDHIVNNRNFYQRSNYTTQFINLLTDMDLVGDVQNIINKYKKEPRLDDASDERLTGELLEEVKHLVFGAALKRYPEKYDKEIIVKGNFHISNISTYLASNITSDIYSHKDRYINVAKNFFENSHEIINESPEPLNIELAADIINYKIHMNSYKKTENYPIFLGHLIESLVESIIEENIDNKKYDTRAIAQKAVCATVEEVETKTLTRNPDNAEVIKNSLDNFVNQISEDDDFLNYIDIVLRNQIKLFYESIVSQFGKFRIVSKIKYTYRSVSGEADYLFINENNEAILVDCKYYSKVDVNTMLKFMFQLIGYYQQHYVMKARPTYRKENNYNIKYFMIVNPMDANYKFTYYLLPIDEINEKDDYAFDSCLDLWEEYITKCVG